MSKVFMTLKLSKNQHEMVLLGLEGYKKRLSKLYDNLKAEKREDAANSLLQSLKELSNLLDVLNGDESLFVPKSEE